MSGSLEVSNDVPEKSFADRSWHAFRWPRHSRHIPALTANNAVSLAQCMVLCAELRPVLRLADELSRT